MMKEHSIDRILASTDNAALWMGQGQNYWTAWSQDQMKIGLRKDDTDLTVTVMNAVDVIFYDVRFTSLTPEALIIAMLQSLIKGAK